MGCDVISGLLHEICFKKRFARVILDVTFGFGTAGDAKNGIALHRTPFLNDDGREKSVQDANKVVHFTLEGGLLLFLLQSSEATLPSQPALKKDAIGQKEKNGENTMHYAPFKHISSNNPTAVEVDGFITELEDTWKS